MKLMHKFAIFVPLVAAICFMCGCKTTKRASDAALRDMHGEPKLKEGFSVDVTVLVAGTVEVKELSKRVTADGHLTLPLIGEVPVVPLTLKELGALLQKMYSEYFVNPTVTVEFSKDLDPDAVSPWGSVTVLGRVLKTGKVNIPPTRDLTVSRAIQLSGGYSSSANKSAIRVVRRLKNGETQTIKVNLKSLGDGKIDQDILLYPGDVITVPEKVF